MCFSMSPPLKKLQMLRHVVATRIHPFASDAAVTDVDVRRVVEPRYL